MSTRGSNVQNPKSNFANVSLFETQDGQQPANTGKNQEPVSGKSIMILGAGFDQVPMIKTAKSLGLRVIAVDGNKNSPGFFISDENYQIDVMESQKILEVAKEKEIDGITTMVSNLGMRTVAYVADEMNLTSISSNAAQIATDKTDIKDHLQKGGVPVPEGFSFSSIPEALSNMNKLDFPVIVKPVDGTKGRGISVAATEKDFEKCINQGLQFSIEKKVIVERWIEGPTIGAECLILGGKLKPILLTDKYNTPTPKCVTIGLTAPSMFPEEVKEKVEKTAQKVADVLGLDTGAAHIDMIVGNDKIPRVIDVGPRLASGPVIFDFVPKLLGVDMVESVIRMAIGEHPEITINWNGKFAASRFLTVPKKGCMYRIDIPKWHKDFTFYQFKELGEIVKPPLSDTDRIGCITIMDGSYEKTMESADELLGKMKVGVVY